MGPLTRRGSLAGDPWYAAPSRRESESGHKPLVEIRRGGVLSAAEAATAPPADSADPACVPPASPGCEGGRDTDGQCPKPNGGVRPV
jgi:hypothetical protein